MRKKTYKFVEKNFLKALKVFHSSFLLKKYTAKTVEEDPAACQRWISKKIDLIS